MARPKTKPADPLLSALIAKLPDTDADWPVEKQMAWLNLMAMAFGSVYGGDAASRLGVTVKADDKPSKQFPAPVVNGAAQSSSDMDVDLPFYIDPAGYARKKGGKRIGIKEVSDTLYDMRGDLAPLDTIIWADGSRGIGTADIMVARAS